MTVLQFLQTYFKEEEIFFFFSLDRNNNKVVQRSFTLKNKGLEKYINQLKWFNKNGSDIYYSLNSFKRVDNKVKRREEYINNIKSFYFDIDKDTEVIYPKIIEMFGVPTFDINTSPNKKQLIYQFDKPFQGDTKYFSQLLQGLVNHFGTDKTFDTPRIFKLIGDNLINNKNGYKINFEYNKRFVSFEEFEKLSLPFLPKIIEDKKRPQKTLKITPKTKKLTTIEEKSYLFNYEDFKGEYKINKKYNQLLEKYNYDYSTTDIGFVKWLRVSKQISNEYELVKRLFLSRGYDHLMNKHSYQIDYYIKNILDKTMV